MDISHISAAKSTISSRKDLAEEIPRSRQSSQYTSKMAAQARNKSQYHVSRYAKIPTENIKFDQFMDILLKSGIDKDTIKTETCRYV